MIDVGKIAINLGGGGHKMASGVRVKTLDEAMKIMNDLDEELAKYNKNVSEGK